jgi:hypothetical protein
MKREYGTADRQLKRDSAQPLCNNPFCCAMHVVLLHGKVDVFFVTSFIHFSRSVSLACLGEVAFYRRGKKKDV